MRRLCRRLLELAFQLRRNRNSGALWLRRRLVDIGEGEEEWAIMDGIRVSCEDDGGNTMWERSRQGILVGRLRDYHITVQWCSPKIDGSNGKFYRVNVSDTRDGYAVLMSAAYSTEEEAKAGAESYIACCGTVVHRAR